MAFRYIEEPSGGKRRDSQPSVIINASRQGQDFLHLSALPLMAGIFCVKDAAPDTLIRYTLGAGGVEALLMAGIKVSKVLAGEKNEGDTQ